MVKIMQISKVNEGLIGEREEKTQAIKRLRRVFCIFVLTARKLGRERKFSIGK